MNHQNDFIICNYIKRIVIKDKRWKIKDNNCHLINYSLIIKFVNIYWKILYDQ